MNDRDTGYDGGYGYGELGDYPNDQDGKVITTPKIGVTDINVVSISLDEILIIKFDNETTNQHEVEQWSRRFRDYLKHTFGDDISKRFIMVPKDWDFEKMKLENKPKEHELYGEKAIKTED